MFGGTFTRVSVLRSVVVAVLATAVTGSMATADSAATQRDQVATEPAAVEQPDIGPGGLVYPEGAAIPRYATPAEIQYGQEHPQPIPLAVTPPPEGPVHCQAEYEPMDAILISWDGAASWLAISRLMVQQITTVGDADVYIAVDTAAEQTSVFNLLSGDGVDMNRVHFVIRTTDTIWIRDYGPRYIYIGECRAIVDHTYNVPGRPNDNGFSSYFSTFMNHKYHMLDLVHGGGNFHLNALGKSFATRRIANDNPSKTEQQIQDIWMSYQNVDTTLFNTLPISVDGTQHIDMWMQAISDDAFMISDWPFNSGSAQDIVCDNAAAFLQSSGYTVYRLPARSVGGVHYTYTNVVMCNDLVMVPTYTNASVAQHNDDAIQTWTNALPDHTIVPLNCEDIIPAAGAIHCIVIHVPEHVGGVNPTAYLITPRGGEHYNVGQFLRVRWLSDDDEAVDNVDVLLSTDEGKTFDTVLASETDDDGQFVWNVPQMYTNKARFRVVTRDFDGHTGFDESDSNITLGSFPGDTDGDGDVDLDDYEDLADCLAGPGVAPNPSGGMTPSECLDAFDLDDDGDVDLENAATFVEFFTGS